jgi:hypothetical protein
MRLFSKFLVLSFLISIFPLSASAATVIDVRALQQGGGSPIGAQRVPFLSLQFAVPCGQDIPLESITLRHRGAGRAEDIERLYGFSSGRRVTRSASFNDNQVTVRFRGFPLKQCSTQTVQLLGDIAEDASAEGIHALEVTEIESGLGDGISFKIQSGTTSPSRVRAGATVSTINIESLPLLLPLRYGAGRTVGRFRIEAEGSRDQLLRAITLTNQGTATDTDLQRLVLRNSRGALSKVVASLDGDRVRLELDPPLVLSRGDSFVWEVRADIRASSRKTVLLTVEEPGDVEIQPCTGKRTCDQAH